MDENITHLDVVRMQPATKLTGLCRQVSDTHIKNPNASTPEYETSNISCRLGTVMSARFEMIWSTTKNMIEFILCIKVWDL